MIDFFDSKFIKDLEKGQFPPVQVEVPVSTFLGLGLTMILSSLIIIVVWNYAKK